MAGELDFTESDSSSEIGQRLNPSPTRRGGVAFGALLLLGLLASAFLVSKAATAPVSPAHVVSAAALPAAMPAVDVGQDALGMIDEGRNTFRHDTFGDEDFWGGQLRLHEAVAQLSPARALALGLKVDRQALPASVIQGIQSGQISLTDPATTLVLLQLKAVVGVTGIFDAQQQLTSIGIQCALCHSTVDDSFAPGVGKRLDGWANRDLDVGKIVALAPDLTAFSSLLGVSEDAVRGVLRRWGPGKFDAELVLDGKAVAPSGQTGATLIPPAFGLAGINLHTWTGWGSATHWNAFVANIEMHGKGTFYDPRLDDATQFPIAAQAGFGHITQPTAADDLITPKLAALHFYQLALRAPPAPVGSFNQDAAQRGRGLFNGAARCSTCHVPPLFSEPGWNMHTAAEIGIDSFQADRSPDRRYRTAPLKGLWTHQTGGFYHDGRFADLPAVVNHYDNLFTLGLSPMQKQDLVQYLLSL